MTEITCQRIAKESEELLIKRFIQPEILTYQLYNAGVGVLSIDTSGSVSDQELIEYVREVTGVIELCSPDKLYIIQHDAIVQREDEWEAGMDFS